MNPIKNDLAKNYCLGGKDNFKNKICTYFIHNTKTCSILESEDMKKFFQECRYQELLYDACDMANAKAARDYERLRLDNHFFSDFQTVKNSLKKTNKPRLASVRSYLIKVCYRLIQEKLEQKGLIKRRKACGTCKHYLNHYCQKRQKNDVNKTDKYCEHYEDNRVAIRIINDNDHGQLAYQTHISFFETVSDCLLKRMIDVSPNSTKDDMITDIEKLRNEKKSSFETLVQFCKNIKNAVLKSKKQEIYQRQHAIMVRLMELFLEDCNYSEASKIISTELGISTKTFKRDMTEIKEYILENC
jgi:hypothetical protein